MSMNFYSLCEYALVLTEKEFEQFKENYFKMNQDSEVDIFDDDLDMAIVSLDKTESSLISINVLNDEIYESLSLTPFFNRDGTENMNYLLNGNLMYEDKVYAIFSKYSAMGIFPPAYLSAQDVENEFIERVGKYLPGNFNIHEHVGILEGVYYA